MDSFDATPSPDPSDDELRTILTRTKVIALLGASDNPVRPSHGVLRYLLGRGYRVLAVNPKLAGRTIVGAPVHAHLSDLPEPVDMVDVFRASAALPGLVDEVLAMRPRPAVIWTQLGVRHGAALAAARAAGLQVVVDRCPRIEIPRLFGS